LEQGVLNVVCFLVTLFNPGCFDNDGTPLPATSPTTVPPPPATVNCPAPTPIGPDSVIVGSLTTSDCTYVRLFSTNTDDLSLIDQYVVTLPANGEFTIQMESTQFDASLILLNSSPELSEIAFDDNSGGGLNALLSVNLAAGTYIIVAKSATSTSVAGAYMLTTSFTPVIWTPTSTTGAPEARTEHTAVWTGTEMIVWGGHDENSYAKDSGARFNPTSETWAPTSLLNAPSLREQHTAVWTGTKMIIWGGREFFLFGPLGDGGRYDPQTNTWAPVTTVNRPSSRRRHTAVWTGTEMIIWGGLGCAGCEAGELGSGARYNPSTDTWTPIATANAPEARFWHTAVWTGSKMIVWGGQNTNSTFLNTGGAYDPVTDTWESTSLVAAPAPTRCHAAVWTGTEMIVFGGQINSGTGCTLSSTGNGARYEPITGSWSPMSIAPVSSSFSSASVIWSGDRLITWFDTEGARYNPADDFWLRVASDGAPSARREHTLVWTGSKMIVWGGEFAGPLDTGGVYQPEVDTMP